MLRSMLLALPVVAATAGVFVTAAGERVRPSAFAQYRPHNSAEAAALGNAAEVVRLLRLSGDPTRVYPVRPEIIAESVQRATTLEAAMWSRRVQMIRLLDAEGAIVDSATRGELACLASDLDLPDVVEYLTSGTARDCVPEAALKRVFARTPDGLKQ
jgi:hypothetical protein